jgi:hypothetical protein
MIGREEWEVITDYFLPLCCQEWRKIGTQPSGQYMDQVPSEYMSSSTMETTLLYETKFRVK